MAEMYWRLGCARWFAQARGEQQRTTMKGFKSIRPIPFKGQYQHRSIYFVPQRQRILFPRTPAQTQRYSPVHRQLVSTGQGEKRNYQRSIHSGVLYTGVINGVIFAMILMYLTDTRAGIFQWLAVPSLRWIYDDAEKAHEAGVKLLKFLYIMKLHPTEFHNYSQKGELGVEVFGQVLTSPLAISAGLDKNGEIIAPLFELGPAIVEIGGITPLPQPGNPKPRVFRISSQKALINRYGLNSRGAAEVATRLQQRIEQYARSEGHSVDSVLNGDAGVPPGSLKAGRLLAIQIAKNAHTPEGDLDAVKRDYVSCVEQLARYADILVINVSSPNTVGLRNLQKQGPLQDLLSAVADAINEIGCKKPALMVKVSPDEDSDEDIAGICNAVKEAGIDGVIVANTTKGRPSRGPDMPENEAKILMEQGGYSGPAMFPKTVELVKKYRQVLDEQGGAESPRKVIFASGGICSGDNVQEVLDAGASVAMVYTAITTQGVGVITAMKERLLEMRKG